MDVISQKKLLEIKFLSASYFDVVFYKEYTHSGGFPEMIRNTFKIKYHSDKIFLKIPSNYKSLLIGSSSLFSFFSCLILKFRGINVTIAPIGQLHSFLDFDNPFEFGDEFSRQGWNLKSENSRRLNGRKSIKSLFRFIYRKIWKQLFVKIMFYLADNVLVISDYEANEVRKLSSNINLVRLNKWFYKPYDKDGIMINVDKNKLNLIYWGRVDIYYKGLDILINSMKKLNNSILYISGGDYRGGKNKLRELIKLNNLKNIVIEEKIISSKNLKDFDYMVLPSRWEGYFRAPHDAKFNDLKVIYRDSTNFDFFSSENDIEFSEDEELINILKALDSAKK